MHHPPGLGAPRWPLQQTLLLSLVSPSWKITRITSKSPAHLDLPPGPQGHCQQYMIPSPASTESLLSHSFGEPPFSPAGPDLAAFTDSPQYDAPARDHTFNIEDLYLKFSSLLDRGLASTADKIMWEIKADLQNIGARMEAIETKLD